MLDPYQLPNEVDTCIFVNEGVAACAPADTIRNMPARKLDLSKSELYTVTPRQANGYSMNAGKGQLKCAESVPSNGGMYYCVSLDAMLAENRRPA